MQAQQTRTITKSISQTQSLAAVQTLLKAGLGAITFLRSLLPEDNFTRSHFTSIDDSSPSGSSDFSPSQGDSSQDNDSSTRHVTGFRIMTMTRGYTDEADRLLNYLEYGIFDALEKQYLKSFIFAIYLDNKDPNNIVEAYTFNFKYHTLPDSNISLPIMTLGDSMQKMTSRKKKAPNDPVTRAIESGRAPTLKDVKQSVKALLKTLIHAMNHMDVLPRRRFATFKVFYTDQTPADYEPPHFQAGDFERDKWFFMTHDLDEVPDRNNVGKLDTGHHSVNLSITSIASFLPSSTELDHTTFTGTTSHPVVHTTLTPVQEALACKQQVEKQTEDAEIRNVVWSSEDCLELEDLDADGDDDPDYIRPSDGHYQTVDLISLVGVREKDGHITATPDVQETDEAQFGGFSENIPTRLDQIIVQSPGNMELEETQSLSQTPRKTTGKQDLVEHRQLTQSLVECAQNDPWATPSTINSPLKSPSSFLTSPPPDFDPEMFKNMHIDLPENPDIEMLGLETQIVNHASETLDAIESFESQVIITVPIEEERPPPSIDNGLDCECGVSAEDESCFCEGGCGNWFHVWCMGYHAVNDPRMPPQFICFACRARKDIMWELIKLKLYPQMLGNFKELALFRRAIKVAEQEGTFSLAEFTVVLGGDSAQARAMVKRLEKEEFISEECRVLDDLGLQTRTKNVKGKIKGKQPKPRKNIQRIRYVFNHVVKIKTQYLDYFRPDNQSTENRLIRLSELKKASRVTVNPHQEETQTQEETQGGPEPLGETSDNPATRSKRPGPGNDVTTIVRPEKKMKISLAVGIDLAE